MAWVSLSFEVEAAAADAFADALFEQGALAVDIADADAGTPQESSRFSEPGEPDAGSWRRNCLSALFPADSDPRQALVEACTATGMAMPAELRVLPVAEQDWVRATQQQFGPIEISPRLWIVPSWCEPPVPGALALRLDPGLAFGTGSHPTTWQCLRWLDEHLEPEPISIRLRWRQAARTRK
jgi:ribosomal protein L11 methyltransferase